MGGGSAMLGSMAITQKYVKARITINDEGCWIWNLRKLPAGYGVGSGINNGTQSGNMLAHRISYEAFKGAIPEGLTIDQLCRIKVCVNPDHLEAVTHKENLLRAGGPRYQTNLECTRCGRMKMGDNFGLQIRDDGRGRRYCKHCDNKRRKENYAKAKASA